MSLPKKIAGFSGFLGFFNRGRSLALDVTQGFDDLTLERLAKRPLIERGLAPWAAWEAERTGFGIGFRRGAWFPPFLPLLFTSDHYADPITELHPNETGNRLRTHLSWYGPKVEILRHHGVDAHCVPHPWNNLRLAKKPRVPGHGTLVFLPHGRKGREIQVNWDGLRTELAALPDWYQPFTVMLGAVDIVEGFHLKVRKNLGLPIVTAGQMESQFFPYRFWRIVSSFSQTAGASSGSHTYYSIWAGRPHRLLSASRIAFSERDKDGNTIDLSPEAMLRNYPDPHTRAKVARYNESLSLDHEEPTEAQINFVEECLNSAVALRRFEFAVLVWSRFFRNIRYVPHLYLSRVGKVWDKGRSALRPD